MEMGDGSHTLVYAMQPGEIFPEFYIIPNHKISFHERTMLARTTISLQICPDPKHPPKQYCVWRLNTLDAQDTGAPEEIAFFLKRYIAHCGFDDNYQYPDQGKWADYLHTHPIPAAVNVTYIYGFIEPPEIHREYTFICILCAVGGRGGRTSSSGCRCVSVA